MDLDWPWQYDFPPFFTIQPNETTRKTQLAVWCKLVLKYQKLSKKYVLDINEVMETPLFSNKKINRSLSTEGILMVLEALMTTGNAEPSDKARSRWYIYWHKIDEWADIIYSWAQDKGQIDNVCTLYELQTSTNTEFNGMQHEVLIKVLKNLEKRGCAELVTGDDFIGVKFLDRVDV
ncbi:vacuolar protein-sorting-associated protein 25 [Halyomorpha halys]|uniref:vacuolar protein-sorting-associated protein 25 n=1 Tax=Halyomorpha halys TaxID=286706 RepID=UPI0006D51B9C|nr:vacuolar protein-sorting-associated protein 25 [Halyomorpha halys]